MEGLMINFQPEVDYDEKMLCIYFPMILLYKVINILIVWDTKYIDFLNKVSYISDFYNRRPIWLFLLGIF